MGNIKKFITTVPIPVSGLALGLASLDNFLTQQYTWYTFGIFAVISLILVAIVTLRFITDPRGVQKELQNPLVFGVLPTYCMALMILSNYAEKYVGEAAVAIWAVAIILCFVIMFFFVRKFIVRNFEIKNVFASWIVIFVGYVVGAVTSPVFGMQNVGKALFCLGLVFYFAVMPVILYRLIWVRDVPEGAVPSTAIITAPMNLCIVGYIAAFSPELNGLLIDVMAVIGILSYVAVLAYMPVMLNKKFYPSYAGLTFPMVISAISIERLIAFYGLSSDPLFHAIQIVTTAIAVAVVVYVLIRYLAFFYQNAKKIGSEPPTVPHS